MLSNLAKQPDPVWQQVHTVDSQYKIDWKRAKLAKGVKETSHLNAWKSVLISSTRRPLMNGNDPPITSCLFNLVDSTPQQLFCGRIQISSLGVPENFRAAPGSFQEVSGGTRRSKGRFRGSKRISGGICRGVSRGIRRSQRYSRRSQGRFRRPHGVSGGLRCDLVFHVFLGFQRDPLKRP